MLPGMALLTGLMLGVEGLVRTLIANPFVASVAGLAMASELTQSNFPYLLFTFFVLLALTLLGLCLVTLGPRETAGRARGARAR